MSKNTLTAKTPSGPLTIDTGWDRPLRYFFLNVYDAQSEPVYISLEDPALWRPHSPETPRGGLSFEELTKKFDELGIKAPSEMLDSLEDQGRRGAGNEYHTWSESGT